MRPILKPALRRLWRDPTTLQLGLHPDRAVVLTGVDDHANRVLRLLDGTRDRACVLRDAGGSGVDPSAAGQFLDLLELAGALEDAAGAAAPLAALTRDERERLAPDLHSLSLVHPRPGTAAAVLRRRQEAHLRVVGSGRLAGPLAALLAAAGVGDIEVVAHGTVQPDQTAPGGWTAADVHRPAEEATADLLRRAAIGGASRAAPRHRGLRPASSPDLVVLVEPADDPVERDRLQRSGTPHLLVGLRELTGFVGPLVLPGQTPCLRCLDLTRTDRDPAWPMLAAQLGRPGPAACDVVLAAAVAALGAGQALAHLDGTPGQLPVAGRRGSDQPGARRPVPVPASVPLPVPASLGGVVEIALPDWTMRRRRIDVHPSCGCAWADTG